MQAPRKTLPSRLEANEDRENTPFHKFYDYETMSRSHLIVDVEQGLQFQILDAPGTILDPGHLS